VKATAERIKRPPEACIFLVGGGGSYTARARAQPPPPLRLGMGRAGGPRCRKQSRGPHRSRRQPTPLPGLRCGTRLARRASPPRRPTLHTPVVLRAKKSSLVPHVVDVAPGPPVPRFPSRGSRLRTSAAKPNQPTTTARRCRVRNRYLAGESGHNAPIIHMCCCFLQALFCDQFARHHAMKLSKVIAPASSGSRIAIEWSLHKQVK
jgi:hypothetical protein